MNIAPDEVLDHPGHDQRVGGPNRRESPQRDGSEEQPKDLERQSRERSEQLGDRRRVEEGVNTPKARILIRIRGIH